MKHRFRAHEECRKTDEKTGADDSGGYEILLPHRDVETSGSPDMPYTHKHVDQSQQEESAGEGYNWPLGPQSEGDVHRQVRKQIDD